MAWYLSILLQQSIKESLIFFLKNVLIERYKSSQEFKHVRWVVSQSWDYKFRPKFFISHRKEVFLGFFIPFPWFNQFVMIFAQIEKCWKMLFSKYYEIQINLKSLRQYLFSVQKSAPRQGHRFFRPSTGPSIKKLRKFQNIGCESWKWVFIL